MPLLSNKLCYLSVLYLQCYLALRSVKLTLAAKSVDRVHTIQANTTSCLIVMVVTCQIESKQLVFHCLFVKCIAAQNFNFPQNDFKKNWRKKLSQQQAANDTQYRDEFGARFPCSRKPSWDGIQCRSGASSAARYRDERSFIRFRRLVIHYYALRFSNFLCNFCSIHWT